MVRPIKKANIIHVTRNENYKWPKLKNVQKRLRLWAITGKMLGIWTSRMITHIMTDSILAYLAVASNVS